MRSVTLIRGALSIGVAAASLVGCGRSQTEIGAPDVMRQTYPSSLNVVPRTRSHGYRVLFSFGSDVYGLDGVYPVSPLLPARGAFYGTTEYGGAFNGGTVFSLSATGGDERVLYSFENGSQGGPIAGLVEVRGTLYGTTPVGGKYGAGMLFSMSTSGTNVRVVHTFGEAHDGANPRSNLIALNGRLYGTTYQGGANGLGTLFTVRLADGRERVLHSFSSTPDGAYPTAGLFDLSGTLYGTTEMGGANGNGTVFSVSRRGAEVALYSFSGPDGSHPMASVTSVNGSLYGTTLDGGSADLGTVFAMSANGKNERVLHSFTNSGDGTGPVAGVLALKGALYGTTPAGGAAGSGTLFRVSMTGRERVLHSFGAGYLNDGLNPQADLVDVKGTIYGTTSLGGVSPPSCHRSGPCDFGTVFALTP